MDDIQTGGAWAIISRMFRYDQGYEVREQVDRAQV
jgi:hypothetical protein